MGNRSESDTPESGLKMAAFPDVCEEEDGKDCSLAGSLAAAEAVVDEATLSEMLRAAMLNGGWL